MQKLYRIVLEHSFNGVWNGKQTSLSQLHSTIDSAQEVLDTFAVIPGAIMIDNSTVYVSQTVEGRDDLIRIIYS